MKNAQFSFDEFTAMIRRRKIPFLIPIIIVTMACTIGAFLLPKLYESSTTILVQGEGVLNPLVNYTMAVAMQSDDQLRDFNEIVYSSPNVEALMDSLGMKPATYSEADKEKMIKEIPKNIKTDRDGSNSFTISYYATSPEMAQKAVRVLGELFIQTKSKIENSKNNFAVQFLAQRLDSLRDKFEQSQQRLVGVMRQNSNSLPEDDRLLYVDIDDNNKQINQLQSTLNNYQQALHILQSTPLNEDGKLDLKSLYELPLLRVPYSDQLQAALTKYDGLLHKFTEEYPDVQDARADLLQLLERTKGVVESDVAAKQNQIWALEKVRDKSIGTVQKATISKNQNQDIQSNFDIYKDLYNDMKIKLEQAQTSQELGKNDQRAFVVIDPPDLPTSPAKPNRTLMIAGGFSVGIILGLFAAGLAELLDSKIRTPMDMDAFNKPVIAYLPLTESNRRRAR